MKNYLKVQNACGETPDMQHLLKREDQVLKINKDLILVLNKKNKDHEKITQTVPKSGIFQEIFERTTKDNFRVNLQPVNMEFDEHVSRHN
jgi:hypothetical protein